MKVKELIKQLKKFVKKAKHRKNYKVCIYNPELDKHIEINGFSDSVSKARITFDRG